MSRPPLRSSSTFTARRGTFAIWLVRFVETYMYKTSVYDPVAWSLAAGALVAIAVIGALLPSLRASRVDPVKALRVE